MQKNRTVAARPAGSEVISSLFCFSESISQLHPLNKIIIDLCDLSHGSLHDLGTNGSDGKLKGLEETKCDRRLCQSYVRTFWTQWEEWEARTQVPSLTQKGFDLEGLQRPTCGRGGPQCDAMRGVEPLGG